jgi:hypothetical protein
MTLNRKLENEQILEFANVMDTQPLSATARKFGISIASASRYRTKLTAPEWQHWRNRVYALDKDDVFYEGSPCAHGHTVRYAKSGKCYECKKEQRKMGCVEPIGENMDWINKHKQNLQLSCQRWGV